VAITPRSLPGRCPPAVDTLLFRLRCPCVLVASATRMCPSPLPCTPVLGVICSRSRHASVLRSSCRCWLPVTVPSFRTRPVRSLSADLAASGSSKSSAVGSRSGLGQTAVPPCGAARPASGPARRRGLPAPCAVHHSRPPAATCASAGSAGGAAATDRTRQRPRLLAAVPRRRSTTRVPQPSTSELCSPARVSAAFCCLGFLAAEQRAP